MKNIVHQILSEIHHILGIASQADLAAASRVPGISSHMRDALCALAKELKETSRVLGSSRSESPMKRRGAGGAPPKSDLRDSVSLRALSQDEGQLQSLLSRTPGLDRKDDLMAFVARYHLNPRIRTKDSRRDAVRKIATAIAHSPEKLRRHIVRGLVERADDQTTGWFNVIKRPE